MSEIETFFGILNELIAIAFVAAVGLGVMTLLGVVGYWTYVLLYVCFTGQHL